MKKHLAYYENEWPANIALLTAVENKPFVGYLKGEGVLYTVIPEVQPNNEIWYTTRDNSMAYVQNLDNFGANFVSHTYENGKGVIQFDGDITNIPGGSKTRATYENMGAFRGNWRMESICIPVTVTSIEAYAFAECWSGGPKLSIIYKGTKSQFLSVQKHTYWLGDSGYAADVIHCIDGDIEY